LGGAKTVKFLMVHFMELQISITWLRLMVRYIGVELGVFRPLALVPFLSHPNENIRWEAADSLCNVADISIVEPVFEALQRELDGNVVKRLMWALEEAEAWDKIFLLLDFPDMYKRAHAATALAGSAQNRFVVPLLGRMNEYEAKDHSYYFDCWLALRGIVDRSSVEPILDLMARTPSPEMKGDLLHLLSYTKAPQVFDLLVAEIDNKDEVIRSNVVSGLVQLGNEDARVGKEDARILDALRKLLTDPSKEIRMHAKVAVANWGKLMITQKFKTIISKSGTKTFIPLPFNPIEVWGLKLQYHIDGSVNGHGVRGSLSHDDKIYFLPLGAAWRRDCGLEAGAEVDVVLSPANR
jgi:hypothetical protein